MCKVFFDVTVVLHNISFSCFIGSTTYKFLFITVSFISAREEKDVGCFNLVS